MKPILTLCLTLFILSYAFGQTKSKRHNTSNQNQQIARLHIDPNKIAIFNLDSEVWLRQKFDNSKSYILNNTDIDIINRVFKQCLRENKIDTNYYHYRRQYVPFVDKAGKRMVWVNCFCEGSDDFSYWKKNIVFVDDGGSCFFNVIINLTDKTYSNLQVNSYE
jgi:hypothetical protein